MIQRRKDESFALSQLSGAFFFIAFAALLWLIIKLSANYTVTEPLCVNFNNPPSELIITDGAESQTLNVTLSANGFDLLNYYFKRISKRKVDISLEEVPLHKESEGTYSVGSYYVKERIANLLKMESQEVSLNENKLFLNMQKLDSKRVKLSANIDITYDKQYNRHGKIQIEPDSITLYGPENIIKDIYVFPIGLNVYRKVSASKLDRTHLLTECKISRGVIRLGKADVFSREHPPVKGPVLALVVGVHKTDMSEI